MLWLWIGAEKKEIIIYSISFNQRTVSLLGRQLDISSNEVYQQFDKDIDTPKRGDFVPFCT